jgi:hypothetical protein
MSLATATTWFFNAVISLTWPSLVQAWTSQGAFAWYATWNIVGWILVLLFVPETKEKTLEELDAVFNVPLRSTMAYGIRQFFYFGSHYVLRRDMPAPTPPYDEPHPHQHHRASAAYSDKPLASEREHDATARV